MPSAPSSEQRYTRRPGSASVGRTPETVAPASVAATASSAARSSSSFRPTSPTIGGVPSVDAKELFAPLGPSYDRVGATLSFGQDPRWRRFLVSRLPRDGGHVLDVATGTGLVAAELVRRGFRVTGVDQSAEMLARRATSGSASESSSSKRLPRRSRFADAGVRPPDLHVSPALRRRPGGDARGARASRAAGRHRGVARVRRAGRARAPCVGALRPGRPPARGTRAATRLERGRRLPRRVDPLVLGARIRSSASSSSGAQRASETSRHDGSASAAESSCGDGSRERSVGETVVVRARDRRLARLRDAPAPAVHGVASLVRRHRRLPGARDRLGTPRRSGGGFRARGRDRRPRARRAARTSAAHGDSRAPCSSCWRRSRSAQRARSASSGAIAFEPWLALLVPVGVFLVLAYNLELLEGRFHSDLWFGLAWGGFPVVCGYAAVAGELSVAALLAAAFAVLLSLAQRALSNHVRFVRRRVAAVDGALELEDGSRERLDADSPHRSGGARAAAPRGCVRGARGRSRRVPNSRVSA